MVFKKEEEATALTAQKEAPVAESEARYWWMAVYGFFIFFSETGVRQVMNVFVPSIMVEFNCTKTQADTAAIMMPSASSLMAGPVAAILYQYSGARVSICIGSVLCFFGFLIGSFVNSIGFLYICGLSIGIGCAFMRNSIISVQCEYFTKRRDFAMAFIAIGPGIGIFVLPRVFVPILKAFSLSASWQVLSSFYVVTFLLALAIEKKPSSKAKTFKQLTGIQVWLKIDFVVHVLASFCATCVCIIYMSNILGLMREEGIEHPEHVYSYQGIASIVGRLIITAVMYFFKTHIAIIMIFNYALAQSSLFSAAFCYNIWEFRAQNAFSGFGIGMFSATLAPFLVAIVGPAQLPGALGYTNLVNGLAAFAAVLVSGSVVKHYETARAAFYMAIVLGSLAIAFCIVNSTLLLCRSKNRRTPSLSQMENAEELQTLRHLSASES